MKKYMLFLSALLLTFLPMNATLPIAPDGDEGDPEEIIIEQKGNENPTSLPSHNFIVSAFKTNTSVYVSVSNFTGNVFVVISGTGGSVFEHEYVNGFAVLVLDISSLSHGYYTLTVSAGTIYQGEFII